MVILAAASISSLAQRTSMSRGSTSESLSATSLRVSVTSGGGSVTSWLLSRLFIDFLRLQQMCLRGVGRESVHEGIRAKQILLVVECGVVDGEAMPRRAEQWGCCCGGEA